MPDATLKRKLRLHHFRIVDHSVHGEFHVPDKRQHGLIIREDLPLNLSSPRVRPHSISRCIKREARPRPFMSACTITANSPDLASKSQANRKRLPSLRSNSSCDKRHLSVVIDLGQPHRLLRRQLPHRTEEAKADILRRQT